MQTTLARILYTAEVSHPGGTALSVRARWELALVSLAVVGVNVLDLASTWLASPHLLNEWNALHRYFGLGWWGLIAAKVTGGLVAASGYWYYLTRRDSCYPRPGLGRIAFYRYLTFGPVTQAPTAGEPDGTFIESASHVPGAIVHGWRHLGVNLGYFWTGIQLLVLWVAIDNIALHYGYVFPLRTYSELVYHLAQSAVVAVGVLFSFYTANYRRYSGAVAPEPVEQVTVSLAGALAPTAEA